MSKHTAAILIVLLLVAGLATGGVAATSEQTPQQTIAKLRGQLRNARLDLADANNQIDAQNQVLSDQGDTIQRLRYRLANQPDPLDVITARGPDGLWVAMVAIWRAFPTLDPGALCGYDKTQNPGDPNVFSLTSFSFYRWQGC